MKFDVPDEDKGWFNNHVIERPCYKVIWITFSSLSLLLLGPIIFQEFAGFIFLTGTAYDLYVVLSGLVLILMLLPVYVLSATRVYLIISDPNTKEAQETHRKELT